MTKNYRLSSHTLAASRHRVPPGQHYFTTQPGSFFFDWLCALAATPTQAPEPAPTASVAGLAQGRPDAVFEEAMSMSWQMVDPFKPAGDPGSYARGQDSGIIDALKTVRDNYRIAAARATDRSAKRRDAQQLGPEGAEPGGEATRPQASASAGAVQQRQGLTDEQIFSALRSVKTLRSIATLDALNFARAIERAHGITTTGDAS